MTRLRLLAMTRRNSDLVTVAILYLAAMAALRTPDLTPALLRGLAASLVVMLLPGYAATAALLPFGMRDTLRAVFAIGLGLAMPIGLALIMSITPDGIHAGRWQLAFTVITFGSLLVAAIERRRRFQASASLTVSLPRLRPLALFGVAGLIVGVAIFTRVVGGPPTTSFTELWALPTQDSRPSIKVGVASHEAERTAYRLEVRVDGAEHTTRRILLSPGEIWTDTLVLEAAARTQVEAVLFRLPDASRAYREVSIVAAG